MRESVIHQTVWVYNVPNTLYYHMTCMAQFPWKTIRKKFLYEGCTHRGDRAGKMHTAPLEMRTAPQQQSETILLLQSVFLKKKKMVI